MKWVKEMLKPMQVAILTSAMNVILTVTVHTKELTQYHLIEKDSLYNE